MSRYRFRTRRDPDERFWEKVDVRDFGGCWLWTRRVDRKGYGVFGGVAYAHRYAWECLTGPIPPGMFLDHQTTCPKNCVNPAHLRVVTNKQNMENRAGPQSNNRSTGVRGVYPNHNRWMAKVKHNRNQIYVGTYDTVAEAEAAVIAMRLKLHTHNDLDRGRPSPQAAQYGGVA